jgi:hypothetical protein
MSVCWTVRRAKTAAANLVYHPKPLPAAAVTDMQQSEQVAMSESDIGHDSGLSDSLISNWLQGTTDG